MGMEEVQLNLCPRFEDKNGKIYNCIIVKINNYSIKIGKSVIIIKNLRIGLKKVSIKSIDLILMTFVIKEWE